MTSQAEEATYGVQIFGKLLIKAFADREIKIREIFEDDKKHLDYMLNILAAIKAYSDFYYPHNEIKFKDFTSGIDAFGKEETQEVAMKVSKYIFEYLSAGVTIESLSTGKNATPQELKNYSIQKVQKILYGLANDFVDPEENETAEIALQELCVVVVTAGYLFFSERHNRSGDAINGAFTSGIGLVNLFRISDEYDKLAKVTVNQKIK